MDEREICCCGAGGWAKVIAWLQIVLNTLFMIMIGLNGIIRLGPGEFKKAVKNTVPSTAGDSVYAIAVTILVITIAVAGIAVMMGVVLLKGSKERNTRYLRWWIIYATICMVWEAISVILNTTDPLSVSLVRLLLTAMYCFGIWVVRVHVKEIESQCAPAAYGGQSQYGKGP